MKNILILLLLLCLCGCKDKPDSIEKISYNTYGTIEDTELDFELDGSITLPGSPTLATYYQDRLTLEIDRKYIKRIKRKDGMLVIEFLEFEEEGD